MSVGEADKAPARPRTILVGLGAAKAGTSWLHRYLRAHPACAAHGPKELHFFDSRADGSFPSLIRKHEGKVARFRRLAKEASSEGESTERFEREAEAQLRWIEAVRGGTADDWVEYLLWSARDAEVAFDITPAYGMLDVETLKEISALHPRVRFVYLMRDPVDRLWSHAVMRATRAAGGGEEDAVSREAEARDLMRDAIEGGVAAIVDRGDYAGALARLRELDPQTCHVAFYEELFTDQGVAAICRLLDIEFRPGRYDRRVHGGPKASLDPRTRAMARAYLAPQYEAANAWAGRLPEAWRQAEAA